MLWLPVALGAGVAAWFVLPDARSWTAATLAPAAASAARRCGAAAVRGW
ncbi:hypothetical protein AB5I41_17735 [Sphingomonas sp. MMS24-JH45]